MKIVLHDDQPADTCLFLLNQFGADADHKRLPRVKLRQISDAHAHAVTDNTRQYRSDGHYETRQGNLIKEQCNNRAALYFRSEL
jgi:hypothetical protein